MTHISETNQREYTNALLKFIPATVVHHLAEKPKEERTVLPQCQLLKTAVLVAEIKGFYGP